MGLAFAFSSVVFILVNALSEQVVTLFIGSGNTELPAEVVARCISEGSRYIRCISYDYLIASLHFCINGLAISAGQTMFSLLNASASSLLLRVPAAWILGIRLGWGLPGVGFAAPIAGLGSLTIGIIYLISGRWRVSSIKDIRAVTN
jgi:Na+-driven multidrug efflux pump